MNVRSSSDTLLFEIRADHHVQLFLFSPFVITSRTEHEQKMPSYQTNAGAGCCVSSANITNYNKTFFLISLSLAHTHTHTHTPNFLHVNVKTGNKSRRMIWVRHSVLMEKWKAVAYGGLEVQTPHEIPKFWAELSRMTSSVEYASVTT
jgi:hypothetical protein